MRSLIHVLLVSLLSVAAFGAEPVYLIYDEFGKKEHKERGIDDGDRAILMRLFCSIVPLDQWPRVSLDSAKAAGTIIDERFDYFPDGYQLTYQELIDQLLRANGLSAAAQPALTDVPAGTIVLPPVPLRGQWYAETNAKTIAIRGFRLRTQGYSRIGKLTHDALQFTDNRNLLPARVNPFHDGTMTVVEIDSPETLLAAMDRLNLTSLPGEVVLQTGNLAPTVTLLAVAPSCTAAAPQLFDFSEAEELRKRLSATDLADSISSAAESMPLVVIDFDFKEGHGAAVLDVIRSVLEPLGLFDKLDRQIIRVDFDRRDDDARSNLRSILGDYKKFVASEGMRTAARDLAFVQAETWLNHKDVRLDPDGRPSLSQEINEQIFYALLWKYFRDQQAWVNMSFFIDSPEFRILDGIAKSPSFAVIAAGNDAMADVPESRYPQAAAKLFDNFVNVTYGTRGGDVCGSRHSATVPVGLVAPGAGFSGGHIGPQQEGSSFASPYVAAISWLKRLTDGIRAATMREVLMDHVEPSESLLAPIASGGFFDGATMLAFPGEVPPPFYVDAGGTVHTLTAGKMRIDFTEDGSLQEQSISPNFSNPAEGSLLKVFRCGIDTCMWLRRNRKSAPVKAQIIEVQLKIPCSEPICDLDALAEKVRYLWF
jgi:hypothetical protein